jgi:hypothetical protein
LARSGFDGSEGAVEEGCADAVALQAFDLVLHQGDQGRDDDHQTRAQQGGELEAEGFAAAGWHDHEEVLARDRRFDDFSLAGAKFAIAVVVFEGGFEAGEGGVGDRGHGVLGRYRAGPLSTLR